MDRLSLQGLNQVDIEQILKDALQSTDATDETRGLGSLIHQRFMSVGGVELALPARDQSARKADSSQ